MSSTEDRLGSVVLSMGFEAFMEDIMAIRIIHRDKNSISIQQDIRK